VFRDRSQFAPPHHRIPQRIPAAALVCAAFGWLVLGGVSPGVAEHFDSFESAETSWRLGEADCVVRLAAHERTFQVAHSGNACEYLRLSAGQGTYVHLTLPVERARVIAEWTPSIWVKADRPGIQFMARAVLPRSVDSRTGLPLTALLRGDSYSRVGGWQQLMLSRPDVLLERQVRTLRAQIGPQVDPRDAYVDMVVLNAYGGAGTTNLWIDDLRLSGHVAVPLLASQRQSVAEADVGAANGASSARGPAAERVRLHGSKLLVDGRPLFVRAIEHNGESFDQVRSLGFNTVRVSAPPTEIQRREAERLSLWLVAPPPGDGAAVSPQDWILAWDVGNRLTEEHLEATRARVAQLRRTDSGATRPVIGGAEERMWSYSRFVDLLLLDQEVLGSSLSLADYGQWLRQRPAAARPGTPWWAAVPTEISPALEDQWSAIGLGPPQWAALEPEQIRLVAYEALAAGARGLLFKSRTPLDRQTPDAQVRARALRRLNLELQGLEPWLAGGSRAPDVDTGAANVRVSMLQTERAQLLLVRSDVPDQQYTVGPASSGPLALVIPCAAKAPNVFLVTPAGLQTLASRRRPGGIRIALQDVGTIAVVAAADPLATQHLVQALAETKNELCKLHHELAAAELQLVEQLHTLLAAPSDPQTAAADWLRLARSHLRHCELLLGANDAPGAFVQAERSRQTLAQARRFHWGQAAKSFPSPVASPYCVSLAAVPWHWEMARRLQAAPTWSGNLLPAGDFESLEHLRHSGWQNVSHSRSPVRDLVELRSESPHGGRSSLRLQAWVEQADAPVTMETPPVEIVSPPIAVRRGQLVRVHGWVRVPHPITASVEGLKVYDSCGGPALADRIRVTDGWREFVLYRAASRDDQVTVTFALTGLGEAWLDDVTIALHDPISAEPIRESPDQAHRLPPVTGGP
jgi:hypothetical protein